MFVADACCSLVVALGSLFVVRCKLFAMCRCVFLFVVGCLMSVMVRNSLFVVCSVLLFVGCCLR